MKKYILNYLTVNMGVNGGREANLLNAGQNPKDDESLSQDSEN